ncbi:MAG: nucleotide exchange factor GrpE [Desulfomicrobium sp.]|jgi:molecular chaperone GrpE|nr:nucleotide exchange factor GrpE [Desulfomicrobium sp.]NLV96849.1 nucleotide exchange factor GrpE [Desulfovibrionales bacterium]
MPKDKNQILTPEEIDVQDASDQEQELTLEEQYAQLLADMEELKKENLRILADSENFKKRLQREKDEYCKFATSTILEEIIPVIDNLDLALAHTKDNEACKNLAMGVEMTQKIFLDTMKKHGLEQIADLDVPFDPTRHEAMGQVERDDVVENTVCQMMQKGYVLKERLLRPAKVLVSRKCGV